MVRTGLEARCERCGRIEFFADKNFSGDSEVDFLNSGWNNKSGKHLCPNCVKDYNTLMNEFFESFWDK